MRQKTEATKPSAEKVIKDIRRVTRKHYGAEEKIRIVLDGLARRGVDRGACAGAKASPRACITTGRRNSSKPARSGWQATRRVPPPPTRSRCLRRETRDLKEVVAEQALELRLLKKSMIADGGDDE